jgi:tetratricopeptide (TPR) repeat protein
MRQGGSSDYPRVRSLATQARELARGLDPATGVAPLHMLAAGTRLAGDYDEAAELYAESLELNRRLGDRRMVGVELHNLGHLELHRGNRDVAERCFAEVAGLRERDDPYEAAMGHLNQAALAVARGDRQGAAELLGHMQATLEGAGIVLDPDDAFEVGWLRGQLSPPVDS